MTTAPDFDMQAAWLRRFTADADANVAAFAMRLKEAMPDRVAIQQSRGFFSSSEKTTGVTVELGDKLYALEIAGGRLKASVALVVRGITLSTRSIDPADWFKRLSDETGEASEHARALSQSLAEFMEH